MANWTSSVQSSNFNADGYTQKAATARKYSINSGLNGLDGGQVDFLGFRLTGYDVIGINASKISSSVIPAFESYINGINSEIKKIQVTAAKMNASFKGADLQKAVNSYVNKMESFMINYTTQLRAFEDKLMDVKNAWDKSQQVQAQGVNKTSSAFAQINEYKRQINK